MEKNTNLSKFLLEKLSHINFYIIKIDNYFYLSKTNESEIYNLENIIEDYLLNRAKGKILM